MLDALVQSSCLLDEQANDHRANVVRFWVVALPRIDRRLG